MPDKKAPETSEEQQAQVAAARIAEKEGGRTYAPKTVTNQPDEPVDPGPVQETEVEQLRRMVMELQSKFINQDRPEGRSFDGKGGLVGTVDRYPVDPALYPSPVERLREEKRLQRFAFKDNYELNFICNPTRRYQTIDGHWQREPQFNLELIRVIFDEETGDPTNGRYVICRGIFFEDPETAVVVAREQGLEVDEENEMDFLNEMRYIRMRDWVIEAFYPPKPVQEKSNKKEMVIDGKLVDYYEINSETSETIPFSNLKSKI